MELRDVKYLLSETDPARLLPCAAEVTFLGRSNVGKSTLLNAVCGKAVAQVSSTPGRTRALNVFSLGPDRRLVDVPGYGFAHGPAQERASWGPMIEGYLRGRDSLRMAFILIDAKVGPTKLDLQMLKWLEAERVPWRAVATKADQVGGSRGATRRRDVAHAAGLEPEHLAWVSADNGRGVSELRAEVALLLGL